MQALRYSLLLIVVSFFLGSCAEDNDLSTNPLTGSWRIVMVQNGGGAQEVFSPETEVIEMVFSDNGQFSGATSVNQFSGRFEASNGIMTMLEFTTTEVADTTFAAAFYNAIGEAQLPNTTFAIFSMILNGDALELGFGDEGRLSLERS